METSRNSAADTFHDNVKAGSESLSLSSTSSSSTHNGPSTSSLRLFCLAGCFFVSMVGMELALEAVATSFSHLDNLTSAVTLFQFSFCVALPTLVEGPRTVLKKFPQTPLEFAPYIRLAFAVVGATALATYSLHYVSYPTKVVFKSTKLIPTMIVSTVINPHTSKFGPLDYISAALLCIGAAGYSYGSGASGDKGDASTSYVGVAILLFSICCDAIVPNMQQKLMQPPSAASGGYSALPTTANGEGARDVRAKSWCSRFAGGSPDGGGLDLTAAEMMVNLNSTVVLGLLVYMILSGSLVATINASISNPLLLLYLSLIGLGLSTAVLAYTHLIKSAGSVVAVAVGTLRKVATVFLSYIIFPKRLLPIHVYSGLLVLAGVVLHSYSKQKSKASKK